MKTKISKLLAIAALVIGLGIFGVQKVEAGLQTQIDSSTNVLQSLSTNSYALFGDITGTYTNGAWYVVNPSSIDSLYTTNGVYVGSQSGARPANAFIDCSKTTQVTFEVGGYFANTAAVASNVVFQVYHTVAGKVWNLETNVTMAIPAASTNWVAYQYAPPSGLKLFPEYALRQVQNPNTTVTTPSVGWQSGTGTATNTASVYLKAYTGNGI